jgi:antitoxin ParD1/3/4
MQRVEIALAESVKQFADGQVHEGGYASLSEYLQALVRADQKRKAKEKLEEMLVDGLASGAPVEVTAEMWSDLRGKLSGKSRRPASGR